MGIFVPLRSVQNQRPLDFVHRKSVNFSCKHEINTFAHYFLVAFMFFIHITTGEVILYV